MCDHDLARCRAGLADGFVIHDHRRTGLGRIEDTEQYLASLAALWEQSSDAFTDTLYHVAVAPHGSISVGRLVGTLDGGGPSESLFVRLNLYAGGRCTSTELYELDDLERARARFEELRPRSG
jgi:hypothetical protein